LRRQSGALVMRRSRVRLPSPAPLDSHTVSSRPNPDLIGSVFFFLLVLACMFCHYVTSELSQQGRASGPLAADSS
ncbi:MAG: hypothetical protein PHS55_03400, partial [Firmicutes bacterium]|nr:hypothetical protein [Bacillota bacterium]